MANGSAPEGPARLVRDGIYDRIRTEILSCALLRLQEQRLVEVLPRPIDLAAWIAYNRRFHIAIAGICGSRRRTLAAIANPVIVP